MCTPLCRDRLYAHYEDDEVYGVAALSCGSQHSNVAYICGLTDIVQPEDAGGLVAVVAMDTGHGFRLRLTKVQHCKRSAVDVCSRVWQEKCHANTLRLAQLACGHAGYGCGGANYSCLASEYGALEIEAGQQPCLHLRYRWNLPRAMRPSLWAPPSWSR